MADGCGCKCNALDEGQCSCGVDWTTQEVIDLRAEVKKLNSDILCMVEKAASKHLPAYREQGEKLFKQTIRAEEAEAQNKVLREALEIESSRHREESTCDYCGCRLCLALKEVVT